jgi:hypothetical protein
MKLKSLYQEIIKKGMEADIRDKKEIQRLLDEANKSYQKLEPKEKELFDKESLANPFADSRILNGDDNAEIKSAIVGIDVEAAEILLTDRLREKGEKIDLAIAHHPEGKPYANFYEVMDLQVDAYFKEGVTISAAQNFLSGRKAEVSRRVHSANHQRGVDAAKLLGINFLCMHTPCDNLAYQFINNLVKKEKPQNMGKIMDLLLEIPEYRDSAKNNNPPMIALGSKDARVSRIQVEFTGGTEGPSEIYEKLSAAGVDTIIAMHQSEEHYKKCKDHNINVIFASHIASDNLGVNLMIDHLESKSSLKIYEFSGFRRFARK